MGSKTVEHQCLNRVISEIKFQHGRSKTILDMFTNDEVSRPIDECPDFVKYCPPKSKNDKAVLLGIEHFQVDQSSIRKKSGKMGATVNKYQKEDESRRKSTAYVGHERCLAGGDIVVLKHNQNPKYLSYALATTNARKQKSSGKVKSKVVHSSVPAIKEIVIPVPPLPVQAEIVHILDNFTERTTELLSLADRNPLTTLTNQIILVRL